MSNQSNQLKNSLIAWIIIMVIGTVMFILSMALDVQPVETSIALFVIGVTLAGLSLGMTINYSVKIIKQNLNKPKSLPIVEWTFTREEWNQYCKQNLKYKIRQYLKLFYFILVVIIIINVILFLTIPDSVSKRYLALSDLIPCLLILLFIPLLEFLNLKFSKADVKIFDSSVIVGGIHYNWNVANGKLIEVKMLNENPPLIFIKYSIPKQRTSFINLNFKVLSVIVPVNVYELNKSQEIVEMFQKRINEKKMP
ncbi:MAG: hypothetical protein EPN82_12740 [Bacteroidetes bacterium]|nr:MAG: hypothetical protein EPN82_12740 [Bacteroidota bacterium]